MKRDSQGPVRDVTWSGVDEAEEDEPGGNSSVAGRWPPPALVEAGEADVGGCVDGVNPNADLPAGAVEARLGDSLKEVADAEAAHDPAGATVFVGAAHEPQQETRQDQQGASPNDPDGDGDRCRLVRLGRVGSLVAVRASGPIAGGGDGRGDERALTIMALAARCADRLLAQARSGARRPVKT
jgi:hypothetical protein